MSREKNSKGYMKKRRKLAMSGEEGSVHSDEASYQWEVSSGP